jgi:hypothetical protein
MKIVELIKREHNFKIGDKCPYTEPNILESCYFSLENNIVGFFLKDLPDKLCALCDLANHELRSDRVPKSKMNRGTEKQAKAKGIEWIEQYSTILGTIPAKPTFKRLEKNHSALHLHKPAKFFIDCMLNICNHSEEILKQYFEKQYNQQVKIFETIEDKWKVGKIFTSSICNYNISAPYHIDHANIKDTVNIIITKRNKAKGGDLNIPDYGLTIDQTNNSMLVFPVWSAMHGVTPIIKQNIFGYRNSLVFYPLKNI